MLDKIGRFFEGQNRYYFFEGYKIGIIHLKLGNLHKQRDFFLVM